MNKDKDSKDEWKNNSTNRQSTSGNKGYVRIDFEDTAGKTILSEYIVVSSHDV